MTLSLYNAFADLEDPRQAHKIKNNLQDILVLAIIAVLSNAQSWTQIEAFGQAKEAWLKQWLALEKWHSDPRHHPAGVSSTLGRGIDALFWGVDGAGDDGGGRFVAMMGKRCPAVMLPNTDKSVTSGTGVGHWAGVIAWAAAG